jgi:hypothetical protein
MQLRGGKPLTLGLDRPFMKGHKMFIWSAEMPAALSQQSSCEGQRGSASYPGKVTGMTKCGDMERSSLSFVIDEGNFSSSIPNNIYQYQQLRCRL